MLEERRRDRRRGYSFREHVGRLRRAGRLNQVVVATAATVLIVGVSVSRCQSSNITGPAEERTGTQANGSLSTTSTSKMSAEKTALAIFPANLLPAVHPCQTDVTFVESQGQAEFVYNDEVTYHPDGTRSHKVHFNPTVSRSARDKNGKSYKVQHHKCPEGSEPAVEGDVKSCHFHFNGASKKGSAHSHYTVKPDDGPAETCTANTSSGKTCDFNETTEQEFALVEDPLTHEGTLVVSTLSILPSCPVTTLAMHLGTSTSDNN